MLVKILVIIVLVKAGDVLMVVRSIVLEYALEYV